MFCGLCGSVVYGDAGTGKLGKRHYYYTCKKHKKDHDCNKKPVRKEWLETVIIEHISEFINDAKAVNELAERCEQIQNYKNKEPENAVRENLKKTETAIANIMKAIESGVLTETTGARLRELEAEALKLRDELAAQSVRKIKIKKEQVVYFVNSFRGKDTKDPDYRERIIETFVNRVYIFDDHILINLNFSGNGGKITVALPDEAFYPDDILCSDNASTGRP